ncbi:MAG TPA: DUF4350 domain-containing protein [Pyrinomonadaceae bacterium]|nr:DUF4350 domain-containing protein [Pyrinomonadaceae bacterium]
MKQKLFIVIVLILLVALLAVLNAATYVQKDKTPDSETAPNRSSYHPGSTGTQAFYALLTETGRKVTRWTTSLETIATESRNRPSVFVMIGPLRRELSETEKTELMQWVSSGGTLVLIDRDPSKELAMTTTQWQLSVKPADSPELFFVDAADQRQMTADTAAHKPSQPSFFTNGVNAVQPSRFASSINFERFKESPVTYGQGSGSGSGSAPRSPSPYDFYNANSAPPPVAPSGGDKRYTGNSDGQAAPSPAERAEGDRGYTVKSEGDADEGETVDEGPTFSAPIVHVSGAGRNLLVEAPFAAGRIILLSDPYIVSNNGISLVDNSRLAINIVTSREGTIAFDEYHHGYGADNNRLFQYFEGTPVIAIFLQCGLLVALVLFSQSRRFARAIPEPEPDRLSKLEYVSAMAELQQRTQAYDLAIENIYADFRRRVCALIGLDNTTASRRDVAKRIAERIDGNPATIDELMFKCEDVIHGEPIGKADAVELVERIREIEEKLGLKRSGRKGL